MRTTITFRKICDRQDLIPEMETRKQGLEPYMMDRTDMFWADVDITDDGLKAELSYCVDYRNPQHTGLPYWWSISLQYGSRLLDTAEVREKVTKKWLASPECTQAREWVDSLMKAGYFDRGRYGAPNANHARCKHCDGMFEKGTSHPHTILTAEMSGSTKDCTIHHHKQMEKTIKERGLTKQGISCLPDIPSLEEKGRLEWHTVGAP